MYTCKPKGFAQHLNYHHSTVEWRRPCYKTAIEDGYARRIEAVLYGRRLEVWYQCLICEVEDKVEAEALIRKYIDLNAAAPAVKMLNELLMDPHVPIPGSAAKLRAATAGYWVLRCVGIFPSRGEKVRMAGVAGVDAQTLSVTTNQYKQNAANYILRVMENSLTRISLAASEPEEWPLIFRLFKMVVFARLDFGEGGRKA